MQTGLESNLWKTAGVQSLSELTDFPFPSHAEFVTAFRKGIVSVGIEYHAARTLANVTKSQSAAYVLLGLSWIPFLLVPTSISVALLTHTWLLLLGIPASLVGMMMASPYSPLHGGAFLGSLASLGYCLVSGTVLTMSTWLAFTFSIAYFTVRIMNRTAWNWALRALLDSEALTAFLWKNSYLHVKKNGSEDRPHQ